MRSLLPLLVLSVACQAPGPPMNNGLSPAAHALAQRCDSAAQAIVRDHFGAAVLVSVHDTVILDKGYGFMDSAHTLRPTDTTLFNLASISKSFTAVCVAQLHAAGHLQWSDPLTRFFPDLPADKRAITVEQCLTHTSGLGQHYAADGTRNLADAVNAIAHDTLDTLPGTGFRYSNENYELLAAVVEQVSGTPFETYLHAHVLAPCHMVHTRTWSEVNPYTAPQVAALTRAIDREVFGTNWGYIGSGGLWSCTHDLHAWYRAWRTDAMLPTGLLDTLWAPRVPISVGHMARGWFVSTTNGTQERWTRGNEDWGHNGVVRWFPERGVLIIVLTNSGELGDKNTTGNRMLGDALTNVLIPY